MKENPINQNIVTDMMPGRLSLEGYLGSDTRSLDAIIEADRKVLESLKVTAEEIGKKMRYLTFRGMDALGDPVEVDGYEVEVTEYMGYALCPFKDNRKAGKRITDVTDLKSGVHMSWTDIGIHLIKDHGFFQGNGSVFRIEPAEIAEFLRLTR